MKFLIISLIFTNSLPLYAITLQEILNKNGGKLPVPFKELISASNGTKEDVVLVPKGRSLVKDKVSFEDPRILLSPKINERPVPLIIGYSPSTDSLEITSWNPQTKKYDFLEVHDYSKPEKQKIKQDHAGKCTSCHTNTTLLFTPAPWGELLDFGNRFDSKGNVRERTIPAKIFETAQKNNQLDRWKSEYGVDLEEYKTSSSERVLKFFERIASSGNQMNSNEICNIICGDNDLECRKKILSSYIQNTVYPATNRESLVEMDTMEFSQREYQKLKGKNISVSDFLIPDFNPETGVFYSSARNEKEMSDVAVKMKKFRQDFDKEYHKKNPPPPAPDVNADKNDPATAAYFEYLQKANNEFINQTVDGETTSVRGTKIKISPEEAKEEYGTKGFPDRKTEKEIEMTDLINPFSTGSCFNLNEGELQEIRDTVKNKESLVKLINEGKFDNYLKNNWPLKNNSGLNDFILSLSGKTSHARSNEEMFCDNPMGTIDVSYQDAADDLQAKQLRDILNLGNKEEKIKRAFQFFCMECHGDKEDEDMLLDLDNMTNLKQHGEGEVLKKLSKQKMPPRKSNVSKKFWDDKSEGSLMTEEEKFKTEKLKKEMIEAMK